MSCCSKATDKIIMWERNYNTPSLREFIQIAAELTKEEYGEYEIVSSAPLEEGRAFHALQQGALVNVAIGGIGTEREESHLPIYIPLDRGLLGFRVCMVNNHSNGFGHVATLEDFNINRNFIGVGSYWPDRKVFEANGVLLMHTPVFEQLFEMLAKGRFSCLSRGVEEIQRELVAHPGLKIEEHIAFIFPYGIFAYVSKQHPRIKERLEQGLQKAILTGQYQALFNKHYLQVLKELNFFNRHLIILKNNNLSESAKSAINEHGVASFASGYH